MGTFGEDQMDKRYQIIDTLTGDIKGDADGLYPEPMTDEGYRFPAHKLGARMFGDVDFPEGMTDAEIGKMARLARHYMIASTNMLGYRDRREIKPYTGREIGEIVGLSAASKRKQFVSKMCRFKMLQRIHTNSGYQFYVNPAYFMANGKRLSLDLFLLFRDELTPLLPDEIMDSFLRQARDKAVITSDVQSEAERIINA